MRHSSRSVLPGFGLSLGITCTYLSLMVLLPLATVFTRAADLLLRGAKGYEHNAFKINLARRATIRALTQAAAGTPQSHSDKKIR